MDIGIQLIIIQVLLRPNFNVVLSLISDRTTLKFGRRRTWIIISCIPISIAFFAVFSPPATLQGEDLDRWMMFAILGFYSAMTLFFVPHMAMCGTKNKVIAE